MDLDIGCRRNMDPLLYFEVILPQTIPVGVSNDLMFSEKGHPFMDLVIHNLITFDHTYGTNYPTVMFSTGPMFLSAQYGLWPKDVSEGMERQVRVLPKRWYGKNAHPSQMADSYFDHYYGSSWHAYVSFPLFNSEEIEELSGSLIVQRGCRIHHFPRKVWNSSHVCWIRGGCTRNRSIDLVETIFPPFFISNPRPYLPSSRHSQLWKRSPSFHSTRYSRRITTFDSFRRIP